MVLANNYTQSQCLSLDLRRCRYDIDPFIALSERLVNTGLLDRKGESLPSLKELTARGCGYLRPELSILLAYSKMHLYQTLLESELPDQESTQIFLQQYFPDKTRKRYSSQIKNHPLRREIIATMITNRIVDQAGCAFLNTLVQQSGATMIEGVAAYLVFDEVLNGDAIREQIAAVDNKMSSARQYELLEGLERSLAGLCRQVFEQVLPMRLDKACVKDYRQRLNVFRTHLVELLPEAEWQVSKDAAKVIVKEGFPEEMALEMASFRYLAGFLPAVHIVEKTGTDLLQVTAAVGEMRLRLKLSQVMESLNEYTPHDQWDRAALVSLRSAFIKQAIKLTRSVVAAGLGTDAFLAGKRQRLDAYLSLVETLHSTPPSTTSLYVVLLRALEAVED
jgi:glutamate dehydrogenase